MRYGNYYVVHIKSMSINRYFKVFLDLKSRPTDVTLAPKLLSLRICSYNCLKMKQPHNKDFVAA